MSKFRLFFGFIFTALFFACETQNTELESTLEDEQLIEAIESATKKTVSEEVLPTSAQTILSQDYADSYINAVYEAETFGYEVEMRVKKGALTGETKSVYFNKKGRKLYSEENEQKHERSKARQKCFELVLPVTFEMADGTTITVESEDDFELIKEWFEANPDTEERPAILFPIEITYADGTVATIASEEEMVLAHQTCVPERSEGQHGKRGHKTCFELVFPVTVELPDGTAITPNNADEMHAALKDWHDANPDVEERAALQFPVEIMLEDGTTQTIASEEEMQAAREACRPKGAEFPRERGEHKACFELVFPVTIELPDGTTITPADTETMHDALKAWREANPDTEERPALQFPVEITFKDGTTQNIANEEEMHATREACRPERDDDKGKRQGRGGKKR